MQITRTVGLATVLVVGFAAAGANAVLVGTPGLLGQSAGFPFGANPGGHYQQVYGSELFGKEDVAVTALSFYNTSTPATPDAPLAPGPFTLSLSTTPRGVDGIAASFDANIGSNGVTVFSGSLPALSGGQFTFDLATPFAYQPSAGNLLLDVQSPPSTTPAVFFDADSGVPSSRLFSDGDALTPDPRVLVTNIDTVPLTGFPPGAVPAPALGDIAPPVVGPVVGAVPEPASMALLGGGLLGLAGLRRRVTG